jgi:5-methylcytosine-specific restriction enzyme A
MPKFGKQVQRTMLSSIKNEYRRRTSSNQRGYNYKWQRASKSFLANNPLCVTCLKVGKLSPSTVVHHTVRHGGDMKLFWNSRNWQGLCKQCHDSIGQSQDKGTYNPINIDGFPENPSHHWEKE